MNNKLIINVPAFPVTINNTVFTGLNKREYFAGLAMQGMLAKNFDSEKEHLEGTVEDAVEYADALLAELDKKAVIKKVKSRNTKDR